jgi:subtilisin family serine protease
MVAGGVLANEGFRRADLLPITWIRRAVSEVRADLCGKCFAAARSGQPGGHDDTIGVSMPNSFPFSRSIAVLALVLLTAAGGASLAGSPLPFGRPRIAFGVVRPVAQPSDSQINRGLPPGSGQAPDGDSQLDFDVRANATVRRFSAQPEAVPDEWVMRLKPGVDPDAAARRLGCVVKRALSLPNTYLVQRDPNAPQEPAAGVAALGAAVDYVEPNAICRICSVPQDPRYDEQWGLRLIQMPAAWDIQKGTIDNFNHGVLVAIVDTGIRSDHPDLQGRLAPGGHNFINGSNDTLDDNGHGTHVAGICAAATDNGVGVAGVTWEGVRLLPVKAFDNTGATDVATLAEAIKYAADNGAQVINVSAGTADDSQVLRDGVRAALAAPQHPILVAAAGNESERDQNVVKPVIYPANYPDPRVIAVAAVGRDGRVAFYSNANPKPPDSLNGGIDIAGPGGNDLSEGDPTQLILSTSWDPHTGQNDYEYMQGTSMATPFVTGAAALLLSEGVAADKVEEALYTTATNPAGTRTLALGWGVLNVSAALQSVAVFPQINWPKSTYPVETVSTPIVATIRNAAPGAVQVAIDGRPAPSVTTQAVDAHTQQINNHQNLGLGVHSLSITATNPVNGRVRTAQLQFQVAPRVLEQGWYMLCLPYTLAADGASPATVFNGQPYRVARWITGSAEYAFSDPETSRQDPRATFNPSGAGVTGTPAGLGYWVKLTAQKTTLALRGDPVLTPNYRIPVAKGWNMVGNPYVFPVGLATLQYQVGSQTLPLAQAVQKGWLKGTVYAFAAGQSSSGYVQLPINTGVLAAYQAVWVQALTAGTLIVPGGS